MAVTIKDIAKKIGISYSSVSRALNGEAGVSQETRDLVCSVAKDMGYQPNDLARGLVKKTSRTIGVVIPDITNPFFSDIVNGIMEAANQRGYDIFLCITGWDAKKEYENIIALEKKRVDGIIIKPSKDNNHNDYNAIKLPVVLLESWAPESNIWTVEMNNRQGGYLATKHLLECGYQNLANLAGKSGSLSSQERTMGWRKAIEEQGMEVPEQCIVNSEFSINGGYEATKQLLEENPEVDGIFASNDVIALGAIQCLNEMGLKVPKQIGVVGFDNITYAGLPQIMLTTVNQPRYEMGRLALELMVRVLKEDFPENKKNVLEPDLVKRKTTKKIQIGGTI